MLQSQSTIHTRSTTYKINKSILSIPDKFRSGSRIGQATLKNVAVAILRKISGAFITKSYSGTDESGLRWAPLSPLTVAARAYSTKRTRTEKRRDSNPSQALTKRQQERWWKLYKQGLGKFKSDKSSAAKYAWFILKSEGAVTLKDKYRRSTVYILNDTGVLLNSLSAEARGRARTAQVLRVGRGTVTVGTSRKGALTHHTGIPGRLPQRRLWPHPSHWPDSWWKAITDEIQTGVVGLVVQLVKA